MFHVKTVLVVQHLLYASRISESCLQYGWILHCIQTAYLSQLSNDMPTMPVHALDALALLRHASSGSSGSDSGGGFWVLVEHNIMHDQLRHWSVVQKNADQRTAQSKAQHARAMGLNNCVNIQLAYAAAGSGGRAISCGQVDKIVWQAKHLAVMTNCFGFGAICLP